MKLSKSKAIEIANFLMEKRKRVNETTKEDFLNHLLKANDKKIPTKIKQIVLEEGESFKYITRASYAQVIGQGFSHDLFTIPKNLFFVCSPYNSTCYINLNENPIEEKHAAIGLKYKQEKKQIEEDRKKLTSSLYALSTEKRILEIFPDAKDFFKKNESDFLPAVNKQELINLTKAK